jgi:HAD superfamily hydrolase (TIGR01484 family)
VNRQRDIRLLLADVDGTLVTRDKILTEATKAAAVELHDAGLVLAITSGRPPRGMSMLIEPLNLQAPIAGFNGGVFVNPDLSVIESHTIDGATARQTLQLMLDHHLDAWIYTADDWSFATRTLPMLRARRQR